MKFVIIFGMALVLFMFGILLTDFEMTYILYGSGTLSFLIYVIYDLIKKREKDKKYDDIEY